MCHPLELLWQNSIQLGGSCTTEICFSEILRLGSPRSKCQLTHCLRTDSVSGEGPLPVHGRCHLAVLAWQKGAGSNRGIIRALTPFMGPHPHDNHFSNAPPPETITSQIRFQHKNFRWHKHSVHSKACVKLQDMRSVTQRREWAGLQEWEMLEKCWRGGWLFIWNLPNQSHSRAEGTRQRRMRQPSLSLEPEVWWGGGEAADDENLNTMSNTRELGLIPPHCPKAHLLKHV